MTVAAQSTQPTLAAFAGPILAQRTWSAQGGPWRWGAPVSYHAEMSPRTLDLLSRAVHLDVNPLLTEEDIDETIFGLNKVLGARNL